MLATWKMCQPRTGDKHHTIEFGHDWTGKPLIFTVPNKWKKKLYLNMKSFDLYLILYIIIICWMLASDGKHLKNVTCFVSSFRPRQFFPPLHLIQTDAHDIFVNVCGCHVEPSLNCMVIEVRLPDPTITIVTWVAHERWSYILPCCSKISFSLIIIAKCWILQSASHKL